MLIAGAGSSSSSSLSLRLSQYLRCQVEAISCSKSNGFFSRPPSDRQRVVEYSCLRSENSFCGTTQFHWLPMGRDICLSRISVAADFSDSVPDLPSYATHNGYHPLEELRVCSRVRDMMPTSSEIARTAVEANDKALLIFPGIAHREPHKQVSWAEFEYIIDDFGDIYFEISDGQNMLQDRGASNPVTALFGMDMSYYKSRKMDFFDDDIFEIDSEDDASFAEEYFEVENPELTDIQIDWGMPETSTWIHPIHFAKSLTEVVDVDHTKLMDHPSNGVSICGFLKPTYIDEEVYLRRLFDCKDSDSGYDLDIKDGEFMNYSPGNDRSFRQSTIYRLDITRIDLFSVYGAQLVVGVQDFQYAEPDILVHFTPSILERCGKSGARCTDALKAFCKKKGLYIERANIIGVDSLGMDVRVYLGTEVRTHRFSFKVRATSEYAADKQIQQLLFPRSRRKKRRTVDRLVNDFD